MFDDRGKLAMATAERIFGLDDTAKAYALCAARVLGDDLTFLNAHAEVIPIFVSQLFQSLEISIKYVGIESGLFTAEESRGKGTRQGHGIEELADLAILRLAACRT